jgi:membrane protease YdiL (CAAX protease family)
MLEEILFRGLLFWLVFEFLNRFGISRAAALSATVLFVALGFAFSHVGRTGVSFCTTVLSGIAFGWMRARSESTAAAALMHAVCNLVLSCIATF